MNKRVQGPAQGRSGAFRVVAPKEGDPRAEGYGVVDRKEYSEAVKTNAKAPKKRDKKEQWFKPDETTADKVLVHVKLILSDPLHCHSTTGTSAIR